MTRNTLTSGAVIFLSILLAPTAATAEQIAWQTDVRSAWRTAQSADRPLLLFVTSSHCPHCRKMQSTTYANPAIARRVRNSYLPAIVNADDSADLLARLNIAGVPTTLVVLPDGRIADRVVGYVPPQALQRRLQAIAEHVETR